jgi:3-deoxy-manno-octulosonate cytidylyltransferase (CMP-KDO synthetase)
MGRRIVFTNGCFDILHVGHVTLLEKARAMGDVLVVGLNSDDSVRRLKGSSRPINQQNSRSKVLSALSSVDAVSFFDEDTPDALLEIVRPQVHVKGGDYRVEDLPEAATVQKHGGEIVIVPLEAGFSTTRTLQQLQAVRSVLVIPARYGSTRFPGKPLAQLGGEPVIVHVARAALQSKATRPVLVATDDERIASAVQSAFDVQDVAVVMTDESCHTGTDRIAQAITRQFPQDQERLVIVNVQGDEPFINPTHIDALFAAMQCEPELQMATLATPITKAALLEDPNVVKVVLSESGRALYFSRHSIPLVRDAQSTLQPKLRHLGVYAYSRDWLLRMAQLPPTPLEESEKLEQLRALENDVAIKVLVVEDVTDIAIDTPQDLERAMQYWSEMNLPSVQAP